MKLMIRKFEVRPGDVVLSFDGKQLLTVEDVCQARAKNCLIFVGIYHYNCDNGIRAGQRGQWPAGHRNDSIEVERA